MYKRRLPSYLLHKWKKTLEILDTNINVEIKEKNAKKFQLKQLYKVVKMKGHVKNLSY